MDLLPATDAPPAVLTQYWRISVRTVIRREIEGKLTQRLGMGKHVRYAMGEVLAVENATPADG